MDRLANSQTDFSQRTRKKLANMSPLSLATATGQISLQVSRKLLMLISLSLVTGGLFPTPKSLIKRQYKSVVPAA